MAIQAQYFATAVIDMETLLGARGNMFLGWIPGQGELCGASGWGRNKLDHPR